VVREFRVKTKVLLLGGSGALNLKVLYCLQPIAETHLLATHPDNIAARSRYAARADVFAWHKPENRNDAVARVNALVAANGIEVIVPGDIHATAFVAENADALEGAALFPASARATLERIHNKWSFAEALMGAGLATPETRLIARREDLTEELAAEIGFPLVVKPLTGESSHGVAVKRDYAALKAHVESGAAYTRPPLIIQSFIPGEDIDISVLADRGRVVASAVQLWSSDADLQFCENPEMEKLAADIVRLFDFHGVAHFDMRRSSVDGRMHVIECNPRFWYSMPAAMWCGLNFVEAGIAAALDRPWSGARARGRYRLPGDVVRALGVPRHLRAMSLSNWRGFIQPLIDPAPHISEMLAKRRKIARAVSA
jgi:biotin carboxylase